MQEIWHCYKLENLQKICRNRDFIAHHYGNFNTTIAWKTMKNDIPLLEKYCKQVLKENHIRYNKENKIVR